MGLIILQLAAAHFVVWALVQRKDWLPEPPYRKRSVRRASGSAALYAGLSFIILFWGHQWQIGTYGVLWLVLGTTILRFAADILCERFAPRSWWSLLGTQTVELWLICGAAALLLSLIGWSDALHDFSGSVRNALTSSRTYSVLVTYLISLLFGGALVRLVTSLLPARSEGARVGMEGAGSIIGILERLLVTSFVLFWPAFGAAAIGLIFSAKSIARFPEMGKKDGTHFAEYYLVGTLTSFTVAIGAGMIARSYLLG